MPSRTRTGAVSSICAAALSAALSVPASWAAGGFVIHDLGTFGGLDTAGVAINNRGQIVGTAIGGSEGGRAFLNNGGSRFTLVAGDQDATAINDLGQILLMQATGTPLDPSSCFLSDGMKTVDLGTPAGTRCFAGSLNNRGQVAGTIQTVVGATSYAFLWRAGRLTNLGSLGGGYSIGYAVNDRGQVVGGSTIATGAEHAFLWEAGRMIDLGAPGASWSIAYAINDRGQVAVQSGAHVYLWQAGTMTDLGTMGGEDALPQITYPFDINERGQILMAVLDVPSSVFRYGVWDRGALTWLPTLGSGRPAAIHLNDRGEVVGSDRADATGVFHLVLWTPAVAAGARGR